MLAGMVGMGGRRALLVSNGSGNSNFSSSGTFNVPADYTSLQVTCHGATGDTGATGATVDGCPGGAGGAGGVGGYSYKVFTRGNAGAPTPGGTVGVTIDSVGSKFNSSTPMIGNKGGAGGTGDAGQPVYNGEGNFIGCSGGAAGSAGASGSASGGDTNLSGSSSFPAGFVTITYFTQTTS